MTQRFGEAPKIRPFAQPIRDIASGFLEFGLGLSDAATTRALYADKDIPVPGYDFTPRDLLGWVGSTIGREKMDPKIWVNRTMQLIAEDTRAGYSVIVDDLRMENEYDALRDRGAYLLRIDRNPDVNRFAPMTATEGRLERREFTTILNTGTEMALREKLWAFIKELPK